MTTELSASDDAVLNDVFSSSRDRGAKDAAPVEEVKVDPAPQGDPLAQDAEAGNGDTEADSKPKGYRDPSSGRFVPLDELKTEREKRQEAQKAHEEEARLRKEAEDNLLAYQKKVDDLERRIQTAPQPRQAEQPPPDPIVDPEGAFNHLNSVIEQRLLNQNLNFSERMTRMQHGNDAVDAAFHAAQETGVLRQFLGSADPYGDMLQWHKRKLTLDRVGADPEAYEKRIREEERQKTIEELRSGAASLTPSTQPSLQPSRFPTGLGNATASGPNGVAPVSDEAVMGSVFNSGRKRK